jgi:uncharacterized integral membrane protein
MRRLTAVLRWTFFSFLVVVAAIAMLENRSRVALEFLGFRSAELPLYWWLVLVFVLGGVCGWLVAGVGLVRARAGAKRAHAELARNRATLESMERADTDRVD